MIAEGSTTSSRRWWVVRPGRPEAPLLSFRLARRDLLVIAAFAALGLGAFMVTLLTGDYQLSPAQVVAAALGHGDHYSEIIVRTFRLPRALTALLVGAALGLSGAIFQSLARNPLVAPDVIGVNTGASLAALWVIVMTGALEYLPLAAFGGGIIAAGISYAVAYRSGLNRYRMLMTGVGINALAGAGLSYLLLTAPVTKVESGYDWLLGSFANTDWAQVELLTLSLVVIAALLVISLPALDVLQLGEDLATSLGQRARRAQLLLVTAAVALAAVGVAFTGPIGFLGFVCPNIARRLTRSTSTTTALAAAATGAAVALLADLAAARVFAPTELPAGVVTVALGGPYFLWLLLRHTPRRGAI